METSSADRDPVELLAEDFLERRRRGESPTIEEYVEKHPDLADEIRDVFPALVVMEEADPGTADLTSGRADTQAVRRAPPLERIGDYRILREIGRGGMGVVYEAEQLSLGRRVALKVLPRSYYKHARSLDRFRREARAAARLHHTNIVPVFEVGQDEDTAFYAMQFIQGQGLDEVFVELRRLRSGIGAGEGEGPGDTELRSTALSLYRGQFGSQATVVDGGQPEVPPDEAPAPAEQTPPKAEPGTTTSASLPESGELSVVESRHAVYFRSVARIGEQTASALSHAHARGVIHRDVKPSNLLLDTDGVVWVTDFGLVKTEDEELTQSGEMLGTLRYMSPERFRGECDTRADIYGLGVTLYELLSLQPAFQTSDRVQLVEEVSHREPPRLRSVDPRVPRDLETVVLKAMDKDPKLRYQTADELRDDLRRFIDDEPIRARRVSSAERLLRWARHNTGLAASLAAIALLLVALTIGSTITAMKFGDMLGRLRQAHERLRHVLYLVSIKSLGEADEPAEEIGLPLMRLRPQPDQNDPRYFEYYYVLGHAPEPQLTLRGHTHMVFPVASSPTGDRIASGGRDRMIRIWDARTGKLIRTLRGHPGVLCDVAWSPDGRRLAAADFGGTVKIWDVDTGRLLLTFYWHPGAVVAVAWDPEGRRLASGGYGGTIIIWDPQSGRPLKSFASGGQWVFSLAWDPEGKRLASGDGDGMVRVWDPETGDELAACTGHEGWVFRVAWNLDGTRLASSAPDRTVRIWDPETGRQVFKLTGHKERVNGLAWDAKNNWLASGSPDRRVIVWDPDSGEAVLKFHAHQLGFKGLCWLADSGRLVTGSWDQTVKVWDVGLMLRMSTPSTDGLEARRVAWGNQGLRAAIAMEDGTIRVWDLRRKKCLLTRPPIEGPAGAFCLDPAGEQLARVTSDGRIEISDAETGAPLRTLGNVPDSKDADLLAWSPVGDQLAVAFSDGTVTIWDVAKGKEVQPLVGGMRAIRCMAWSPDGSRLAAGGDHLVLVWDLGKQAASDAAPVETKILAVPSEWIRAVAWSPDSQRLALAGGFLEEGGSSVTDVEPSKGEIRIWDLRGPTTTVTLGSHIGVAWSVCWNPEGTRVASAGADRLVKIWDVTMLGKVDMRHDLLRLEGHRSEARWLRWSSDGMVVSSIGAGGDIRLWDAAPGYWLERSSKVLHGLNRRVSDGVATARDLRRRAEFHLRRHRLDNAEQDLLQAATLLGNEAPDWWVTSWWVAGPYPGGLGTKYPPEDQTDPSRPIGRQETATSGAPAPVSWLPTTVEGEDAVDFARYLPWTEESTCYALTRIYSARRQEVGVIWESGDRVRMWLNGTPVHEEGKERKVRSGDVLGRATLQEGWNLLLVKVDDATGEHRMELRLEDDPVELALAYETASRWKEALRQWNRAVALEAENAYLRLKRGEVELHLGLDDEAGADFAKATELMPGRPEPYVWRAAVYADEKEWKKASDQLREALARGPNAAGLCVDRGNQLARLGEWEEAREVLAKGAELLHTEVDVMRGLASLHLFLGDEEGFRRLRHQMLTQWADTENPVIGERTVKACLLLPATDEELRIAAQLADRAVHARPDFPPKEYCHFVKAMADYRGGRLEGAVESLRRSLDLDRADPTPFLQADAHAVLAMAYAGLGRAPQARDSLKEARQRVEPVVRNWSWGGGWHDWQVAFLLYREAVRAVAKAAGQSPADPLATRILIVAGRFSEAADELPRVIRENPEDVELRVWAGRVFGRLGRWEQAAENWTKAVELDPDSKDHWRWYVLAPILVELGQEDRYRRHCRQMLARFGDTQDAAIADRTAKVCLLIPAPPEDLRLPIQLAGRAVELEGTSQLAGWYLMTRGLAEYRDGRFSEALHMCRQSRQLSEPRKATDCAVPALLIEAMALCRLGQSDEARRSLHAAQDIMERDPRSSEQGDLGWGFHDWLICRILRREAEALLAQEEASRAPRAAPSPPAAERRPAAE